jgi:hypothetical protein
MPGKRQKERVELGKSNPSPKKLPVAGDIAVAVESDDGPSHSIGPALVTRSTFGGFTAGQCSEIAGQSDVLVES